MRILVVSDIHANAAALAAIREPFDACLCLGDLVEYGPCPAPCIAWVREHCLHTVRGNHDHGAAQNVTPPGGTGFRYLTQATRAATVATLRPDDRRYLARLPLTRLVRLGGFSFLLIHATPRDPLDEYVPPDATAWAAHVAGLNVDFVLTGHTHKPCALPLGRTTVVNPGSVGLSRDGNPAARYAVITDGRVELKSVDYDIARTLAAVQASPIDAEAKRLLTDVYTFGSFRPPPRPQPTPLAVPALSVPT